MIALRVRHGVIPHVLGGIALGAIVALLATRLRASPQGLAFGLALLLAALTGIAKTTTA